MDDDAVTSWAIAAQQGDRSAAAAFIRATAAPLRRLLGYLADPGEVEDLVQETYLRAFASLSRYRRACSARAWLFAIARHVAADQVRQHQRSPRRTNRDPSSDGGRELDARHSTPAPDGLVELRVAIAALDPQRREAFVLTRIAGLSYGEAALVCDCPVGTIRSRVFRARADLLIALAGDERPARQAHPDT